MNAESQQSVQIAIDTGGTFTDVAVRRHDGSLMVWKVPSTPEAPEQATLAGFSGALEQLGEHPSAVHRLVHGTTVATNTVITRDGARVGVLTTHGFRDVLAIGHQARPLIYDQRRRRTEPLVPSERVVEIGERMAADGTVIRPLTTTDMEHAVHQLRALDLDAVVVSFLNSYANPEHEDRAAQILREHEVAPVIISGSTISGEMREFERTSTAVINAYVQPRIAGYLRRVEDQIADTGAPAKIWIMQSNGGLLSPETAAEHAARTVLSGLAGGVVGAAQWARHLGLDRVISFDMGGTSTDVALIRDGAPDETLAGEIDQLPLRLPSVDVHTVGAGGGSIAWQDTGGGLRVGPSSAGAEPGPISYGRGGEHLTVTDAHVVLGRLGQSLLDGRFHLDVQSARERMQQWGHHLGLSMEQAAEGIIAVINTTMARGIRHVSVQRGIDARGCDLISFGGAGPLHCADLVHELGLASAVIPPNPGIASAVGMLDAPVRHDYATPVWVRSAAEFTTLESTAAELEARSTEDVEDDDVVLTHLVDARYVGQSYELTIPLGHDWDHQRKLFDDAHQQQYGFADSEAVMEVVVHRLIASTTHTNPVLAEHAEHGTGQPREYRDVYIDGGWVRTGIYGRYDLPPDQQVPGPLIVDQFDTTVYVRPDQQCRLDQWGFLHVTARSLTP